MSVRSEAVILAKQMKLCTQCFLNKAMEGRFQCERCIMTNRKKAGKRREWMNKRTKDAIAKGICTRCFKNKAQENYKQCTECLEKDRKKLKALKEGREKALGKKDIPLKRKYVRRNKEISPMVMQSLVHELETFISKMTTMKATEYLEKREQLINNIIIRGK